MPRVTRTRVRATLQPLAAPSREQVHETLLHLQRNATGEFDPVALIRIFIASAASLFPSRRFAVQTVAINGTRITLTEGTAPFLENRTDRLVLPRDAAHRHGLRPDDINSPVIFFDEDYAPFFSDDAHGLVIPLVDGNSVLGVVALEYESGTTPAEEDQFALLPLALELGTLLRVSKLLRESKYQREYLATLLEHSTTVIIAVDAQRRLRLANRTFLELSGLNLSDLLGQDFLILLPEVQHERALNAFVNATRGSATAEVELHIERPSGRVARLGLNVAPVLSAEGEFDGAIAIGRDLTTMRELEEQVIQSEKLATLGQLAAGVVHEINNPLTSISVYADYLLKKGERGLADPADLEKLRRIVDGASRILTFTKDLVTYARPTTEEPRPLPINEVLEQAIVFCDLVVSENGVRVMKHFAADLPQVPGVRSQLHQVFINLFTNACHAISHNHGQITVESSLSEDERVLVRVTDNGGGISEKDIGRIFEPFYTTKSEGKGTGLGLSIVRNILRAHGAEIRIDSTKGEGTTFSLFFKLR